MTHMRKAIEGVAPQGVSIRSISRRLADIRQRRRAIVAHDETGAALILALLFLVAIGVVVGSLASWATNDLQNSSQFASARTLQYAVNGATESAVQTIRYSPLTSTNGASTPTACWGTGSTSELTINGTTVGVWCSTVYTPTSANTRVVTFWACPISTSQSSLTPNQLATVCVSSTTLKAVVTFGDYPPGFSAPSAGPCVVYCGTSMTINSWVWS